MTDSGYRVLWCPGYSDKFITIACGQDVKLYETARACKDVSQQFVATRNKEISISDDYNAFPLSKISHIPFRCVALYPKPYLENRVLIALGQLNGTVTVRSFEQSNTDNTGGLFNEREFVPRHERPCNTLAWNPINPNLLAAGLEKARNEVSFFVWDISSKTNSTTSATSGTLDRPRSSLSSSGRVVHAAKDYSPDTRVMDVGATSETTSVAWFPTESCTLITGQGGKFLKIFDIRDKFDNMKPKQHANTKAVYGVCVDPNFEYRVASFVEGSQGVVLVWDTRNFEKPFLVLPQNEHILQIDWNPTRSGLLGTLRKDNTLVHLYDIQYGSSAYGNVSNEAEPTTLERHVGAVDFIISGFSWHPTEENRMLTSSAKEKLRDLTIYERICLSWSPKFSFSWGCGRHLLQCSETNKEQDISIKMYERACNSYGLNWNNTKNVNDPMLVKLWSWFNRISAFQKIIDNKFKMMKFPGVKSVICGETGPEGTCPRSTEYKSPQYLATMYFSEERYIALQLCNWCFEGDDGSNNLRTFLQYLTSRDHFERAAAVAVFNNDIPSAINILSGGAIERKKNNSQQDSFLGMVAMALSGYSNDKKSLWRERCLSLCKQLSDPYLRSLFTFLACENDYTDILKGYDLEIEDQVAFACKYLSDSELGNYLSTLCDDVKRLGKLDGMLVTGLTEDGINLLQNYLNMTGDVQTVSVLAVNSLSSKIVKESVNVNNWIQSYRDLLDRWKLWHQRAEFDIYQNSKGATLDQKQVYVSCTFCGASILSKNPTAALTAGRLRYLSPKENPANRSKNNCIGCRKPLPRCSQCLMHMGTTSTNFSTKTRTPAQINDVEEGVEQLKINPTLKWFTWCQTCHHGGHASHMMQWFEQHTECPVHNCLCNCMNLDPDK